MAKINRLILTKNNCYKTGRKQKIRGGMLHSTGANNPFLSRYLPNDGIVGPNRYNNHWNQPKPGGRNVCVHGFIGKDKDDRVRTYQTLDWNHVAWHSGRGRRGSANTMGYFGIEMCEDDLNDRDYFLECYRQAVELFAHIFTIEKLPVNETTIIDHSEGHKMGIASNHGDVMHWFRRHGKTMDDFRADVKKEMAKDNTHITINKSPQSKPAVSKTTLLAIDGYWGSATTRALQKALGVAVDGVISGQHPNNSTTRAIPSASFSTRTGSNVIRALQRKIGVKSDGYIGPATVRALQKYLGTNVDGIISKPSFMVKEMQRRLNKGGF